MLGDVNEATQPATPQLRVVDAFNPHDPALDDIVRGGITTAQVIPGSANTMGGGKTYTILMSINYWFWWFLFNIEYFVQ